MGSGQRRTYEGSQVLACTARPGRSAPLSRPKPRIFPSAKHALVLLEQTCVLTRWLAAGSFANRHRLGYWIESSTRRDIQIGRAIDSGPTPSTLSVESPASVPWRLRASGKRQLHGARFAGEFEIASGWDGGLWTGCGR
jgi:hypothetical protein